ncbi:hypothetical protein L6164_035200 [Bauhinia variegata]|uniref:Uncharacterized protein n=1 Tax=Bauhinia variegata TaxID=167791 RepID=A0ACB9KY61_BAUVA|nr:hypothetical protein L6164_035200 [Bauhinia variegata]
MSSIVIIVNFIYLDQQYIDALHLFVKILGYCIALASTELISSCNTHWKFTESKDSALVTSYCLMGIL